MLTPALALVAVWAVATTLGPTANLELSDFPLYRAYAELALDGGLPYRDFAFEYPPLAIVPIAAGGLAGTGAEAYEWCFGALMLAAMLVVQREAALLAPAGRRRQVAWMLVALPVLAGAIVRARFDLVAVACALAGLRLVLGGRRTGGFAILAAGTAVKLFPALLAAVALAHLLRGGERAAARRGAAVFALVLAAACLPFLAIAPDGFLDQFRFHLDRPVQVESTPATVLWLLGESTVTGAPGVTDEFRSNGLRGGPDDAVAALFALLQVAAVAATLLLCRRPVPAALAATLAFVALGKVLSPQFLLWAAPLAAVAWVHGARAPAALVAAATLLTQLEFPARDLELTSGDRGAVALVGARNLLLLAALTLLLAPGAAPARSPRRAAAPRTGSGPR